MPPVEKSLSLRLRPILANEVLHRAITHDAACWRDWRRDRRGIHGDRGRQLGIVHIGSFAMKVMRMEKGFKGAGELTNEVTLPEADGDAVCRPGEGRPNFLALLANERRP